MSDFLYRHVVVARRFSRFCFLAAGLLLTPAAWHAASAQTLPPAVSPGRIPEQFTAPTPPNAPPIISVPAIPTTVPPKGAETIHLQVSRIVVEGSTVYSPQELGALTAPYQNRPIVLADLFRLANDITAKYRADGYILSRAVLPAQNLTAKNSVPRIVVIEGYVSSFKIVGYRSPLIEKYAQKIAQSRPLKASVLERYLLLANDLAGVTARAVLSPSQAEGGSLLTIETSHKTLDGSVAADNRGTVYIGPEQFYAGAGVNIPGLDSRLAIRYITTPSVREMQYGEVSFQQPLGDDGLRLTLFANDYYTQPQFGLQTIDTRSFGQTGSVSLFYPWIRSRNENLNVHGGIEIDSFRTHIFVPPLAFPPASNDQLRVLRMGIYYDRADAWGGINIVSVDFGQGLPILGAASNGEIAPLPSRPGARSDFSKFNALISRQQDLHWVFPGLSLLIAGTGQATARGPLPASEQFGLGGADFGRAYEPSDLVGDNGIAGKVELQYTSVPTPSLQPFLNSYQLYTFFDAGHVMTNVASVGKTQMSSWGAGIRMRIEENFTSDFEVAKPLTRDISYLTGRNDARPWELFFSTALNF